MDQQSNGRHRCPCAENSGVRRYRFVLKRMKERGMLSPSAALRLCLGCCEVWQPCVSVVPNPELFFYHALLEMGCIAGKRNRAVNLYLFEVLQEFFTTIALCYNDTNQRYYRPQRKSCRPFPLKLVSASLKVPRRMYLK